MKLFVYGTLKKSYNDGDDPDKVYLHKDLEKDGQKFICNAKTQDKYRLYHTGTFPALIEAKNGICISGELWEISEEYLPVLDAYESSQFERRSIDLLGHKDVEAYFFVNPEILRIYPQCGNQWPDGDLLFIAMKVMSEYHENQYRKNEIGGIQIPYAVHPVEVMKLVWTWKTGNESLLVAALLHDTLEDTSITEDELNSFFGEQITNLVKELTFDESVSKEEYMQSFVNKSVDALIIKIADRICNVKDFLLTNEKYAIKYFNKAEPLFNALKSRLQEIGRAYGFDTQKAMLSSWAELKRLALSYERSHV